MNLMTRYALIFPAVLALALQTPPAAETVHTGCVMMTEGGDYTFCEPETCSLLQGKELAAKLAGHKVTLRGTVQAASKDGPRTLLVSHVVKIGGACTEACSPWPPIHRGIVPKDRPGSEGGTPGVVAKPPQ